MRRSEKERLLNRAGSTLSIVLILLVSASCSKRVQSASTKNIDRSELNIEEIEFDYLTIKSRIKFQEASNSKNASAIIRLKKDSIIWFNLSGTLGVQGVRGILTQDSIKVVNRVDKEYWLLDYDALSKEFNFRLDFSILQAMVLGEMPKEAQEDEEISEDQGRYIIHQKFGDIYIDNYISASNNKVTEVNILEKPTQNSMTLMYSDFQDVEERSFPFSSFVSLIHFNDFGELETRVIIDHSKVEFSDKSIKFPLSIPKKYARK